jgi:hypothetical protein
MKTITGVLMMSALVLPSAPASAQGHLQYQIERIADYALTIAADALGELVEERADRQRDDRQDRQRGPGARDDRGPEFTDTFTRTIRLGRNGRVELENLSGDLEVTGGAGEDVRITATKKVRTRDESAGRGALNATEIEVNERAGVVTVSARPTRGRFGSVEVDYIISVPSGSNVSLKTISGDVTVKNIAGDVRLSTTSGDVVVADAQPRALDIEVISGDVSLERVDSERIRIDSVAGDITFIGKLAKTGRYDLSSHSGDIQVIPEGSADFDLEAATFSGDVNSDFALKLRGAIPNNFGPSGRGPRRNNNVRGSVNDGGAALVLKSFSGDILITKR